MRGVGQMFGVRTKAKVANWHRWMGLALSIPLLGWVISSMVMVLITFDLPNGLQGVFQLRPHNSVAVDLRGASLTPNRLLEVLASQHGLERIHWLRLEARGPHLWYMARATPFSPVMSFDAHTGQRLDPLSDDLISVVANESLQGSRLEKLVPVAEFNRDYAADRVPAVAATMVGEQASVLILSRDNGRTLRRMDAQAENFHWWYKTFHVNQYTDDVIPWTVLLYACACGTVVVSLFGYLLFWWRRKRPPRPETCNTTSFSARNLHRKLGLLTGGILVVQLLAGVYIWLSLGPLNDSFRGKPSFATDWQGGISVKQTLAAPKAILAQLGTALPLSDHPVQAIEWRRLGERDVWLISSRKDQRPLVFDASSGARIEALTPEIAGEIARQETAGHPDYDYLGPLHFQSIDLNRRLPAYRFRFKDSAQTDVYVLQDTGDVIMRRPAFWRRFGPFFATHQLAVTRNKTIDLGLLALFQIAFLALIVTGWRIQFPGRKSGEPHRHRAVWKTPRQFGDRLAFIAGVVLALSLLTFFGWKLIDNLARDSALGPVPTSTPTPPPPPRI